MRNVGQKKEIFQKEAWGKKKIMRNREREHKVQSENDEAPVLQSLNAISEQDYREAGRKAVFSEIVAEQFPKLT